MIRQIVLTFIFLTGLISQASRAEEVQTFDADYMIALARSFNLPAQLQEFDTNVANVEPARFGGIEDTAFQSDKSDRFHCKQIAKMPVHPNITTDLKDLNKNICGMPVLHANYTYYANENYFGVSRFTLAPVGNELSGFIVNDGRIVGVERKDYLATTNQVTSRIEIILPNGAHATQTTIGGIVENSETQMSLDISGANNSFVFHSQVAVSEHGRRASALIKIPTIQEDEMLVIEDKLTANNVETCSIQVQRNTNVIFQKVLQRSCNFLSRAGQR